MNTKKILLSVAVLYLNFSNAQQSRYFNNKENYRYHLAENLYETKVYEASHYEYVRQYYFNDFLSASQKEASSFFENIINVILQKEYADKGISAFIEEYPHSAYVSQASLPMADYYLSIKNFEKVVETLQKINQFSLSKEENQQYVLKLGYAKFMLGDIQGATEALEEAYQNTDSSSRMEIAYMLGHLYYVNNQQNRAIEYFDEIENEEKYSYLVRPYYIQMYFNNKDFDKAILEGEYLLNISKSSDYKIELHKIIGESYFMKKKYSSAYPHLKIYLENQTHALDKDLYEMGFVCSQLNKYDEAVSYYNQLINSKSELSQNAYFQLGNAYLQTYKKQEALSAYRSAYQMNYDLNVKQLAHLQYAKLSYDIGNPFDSASSVIQDYIQNYPNDTETPKMKILLVKSYLYSGNYKKTIEMIDKLSNRNTEIDKINQEVSFLLGTEEFNKGNLDEAEKYFNRSLKISEISQISARALYWLGQVYYNKGNYPSAIVRYEKLLNTNFVEKQQLTYDLGYAYFKSKKFEKAKEYFKEYLKNPKEEYKTDAQLRLADTYYANNQLDEAVDIYNKMDSVSDYTLFQKSMALGFKGDISGKIANLNTLTSKYSHSDYLDDAWYELGTAYTSQNEYKVANDFFEKVVKNSTDKELIANAQIYKAQNYIEQNQEDRGLSELQKLGIIYKNSPYAEKIVQASRPVFINKGDIAGYELFARDLGVKLDNSDIDEIQLTLAKKSFNEKKYSDAISHYKKYLLQNPSGTTKFQAQYELGESYYQTKQNDKATDIFSEITSIQNDYQEDAQLRLAQIYLSEKKIPEAKKYLDLLINSDNQNIRNFANIELMKISLDNKDLNNAERYADEILKNSKNSASILESAKVVKARSLMLKSKDTEAQKMYILLEKSSNVSVLAEAYYAKAYYQNKAKNYKQSNETIFKLANNYASEEYWGAKALLVMSKNYIGLKDKYQASYTIDQVIEHYADFPDVVEEAKKIKKTIK